jgi:hypothetical protein
MNYVITMELLIILALTALYVFTRGGLLGKRETPMLFKTKDPGLAALLRTKGIPYCGCTLDDKNWGIFSFIGSPRRIGILQDRYEHKRTRSYNLESAREYAATLEPFFHEIATAWQRKAEKLSRPLLCVRLGNEEKWVEIDLCCLTVGIGGFFQIPLTECRTSEGMLEWIFRASNVISPEAYRLMIIALKAALHPRKNWEGIPEDAVREVVERNVEEWVKQGNPDCPIQCSGAMEAAA